MHWIWVVPVLFVPADSMEFQLNNPLESSLCSSKNCTVRLLTTSLSLHCWTYPLSADATSRLERKSREKTWFPAIRSLFFLIFWGKTIPCIVTGCIVFWKWCKKYGYFNPQSTCKSLCLSLLMPSSLQKSDRVVEYQKFRLITIGIIVLNKKKMLHHSSIEKKTN